MNRMTNVPTSPRMTRLSAEPRARWRVALLGLSEAARAALGAAIAQAGGQVAVDAPARTDSLALMESTAPDVLILQPPRASGPHPDLLPFTSAIRRGRPPGCALHARHEPREGEARRALRRLGLPRRAAAGGAARADARAGHRPLRRLRDASPQAGRPEGDRAREGPPDDRDGHH